MTPESSHAMDEIPQPGTRSDPHGHIRPPEVASPGRRIFHALISIAGWVLFAYWWWIVFHRVSRSEVRFTLLFIAVAFVACVVLTGIWVAHNRNIFKRRGPRTALREVTLDYSRDPIGRSVTFDLPDRALKTAPVVRVIVEPNRKTYRSVKPGTPAGAA